MEVQQRKGQIFFPWIDDVVESFSRSFMDDYDSDTLSFLHGNVDKEINFIYSSNEYTVSRTKALYNELMHLYEHMRLKISQHSDFSNSTLSCIRLLSQIIKTGLILTQGLLKSEWIGRLLTAVKLFPGKPSLIYDAFLLVNGLKKIHYKPYGSVLKHLLMEDHDPITDPLTYLKVILLYRRLKALIPKKHKEHYTVLATKIKPPSNLMSWLTSLDVDESSSLLRNLQHKKIARQLMKNDLPHSFIQMIREMALEAYYFESSGEEFKLKETEDESLDLFVIDKSLTKKCKSKKTKASKLDVAKKVNSLTKRKRKKTRLNKEKQHKKSTANSDAPVSLINSCSNLVAEESFHSLSENEESVSCVLETDFETKQKRKKLSLNRKKKHKKSTVNPVPSISCIDSSNNLAIEVTEAAVHKSDSENNKNVAILESKNVSHIDSFFEESDADIFSGVSNIVPKRSCSEDTDAAKDVSREDTKSKSRKKLKLLTKSRKEKTDKFVSNKNVEFSNMIPYHTITSENKEHIDSRENDDVIIIAENLEPDEKLPNYEEQSPSDSTCEGSSPKKKAKKATPEKNSDVSDCKDIYFEQLMLQKVTSIAEIPSGHSNEKELTSDSSVILENDNIGIENAYCSTHEVPATSDSVSIADTSESRANESVSYKSNTSRTSDNDFDTSDNSKNNLVEMDSFTGDSQKSDQVLVETKSVTPNRKIGIEIQTQSNISSLHASLSSPVLLSDTLESKDQSPSNSSVTCKESNALFVTQSSSEEIKHSKKRKISENTDRPIDNPLIDESKTYVPNLENEISYGSVCPADSSEDSNSISKSVDLPEGSSLEENKSLECNTSHALVSKDENEKEEKCFNETAFNTADSVLANNPQYDAAQNLVKISSEIVEKDIPATEVSIESSSINCESKSEPSETNTEIIDTSSKIFSGDKTEEKCNISSESCTVIDDRLNSVHENESKILEKSPCKTELVYTEVKIETEEQSTVSKISHQNSHSVHEDVGAGAKKSLVLSNVLQNKEEISEEKRLSDASSSPADIHKTDNFVENDSSKSESFVKKITDDKSINYSPQELVKPLDSIKASNVVCKNENDLSIKEPKNGVKNQDMQDCDARLVSVESQNDANFPPTVIESSSLQKTIHDCSVKTELEVNESEKKHQIDNEQPATQSMCESDLEAFKDYHVKSEKSDTTEEDTLSKTVITTVIESGILSYTKDILSTSVDSKNEHPVEVKDFQDEPLPETTTIEKSVEDVIPNKTQEKLTNKDVFVVVKSDLDEFNLPSTINVSSTLDDNKHSLSDDPTKTVIIEKSIKDSSNEIKDNLQENLTKEGLSVEVAAKLEELDSTPTINSLTTVDNNKHMQNSDPEKITEIKKSVENDSRDVSDKNCENITDNNLSAGTASKCDKFLTVNASEHSQIADPKSTDCSIGEAENITPSDSNQSLINEKDSQTELNLEVNDKKLAEVKVSEIAESSKDMINEDQCALTPNVDSNRLKVPCITENSSSKNDKELVCEAVSQNEVVSEPDEPDTPVKTSLNNINKRDGDVIREDSLNTASVNSDALNSPCNESNNSPSNNVPERSCENSTSITELASDSIINEKNNSLLISKIGTVPESDCNEICEESLEKCPSGRTSEIPQSEPVAVFCHTNEFESFSDISLKNKSVCVDSELKNPVAINFSSAASPEIFCLYRGADLLYHGEKTDAAKEEILSTCMTDETKSQQSLSSGCSTADSSDCKQQSSEEEENAEDANSVPKIIDDPPQMKGSLTSVEDKTDLKELDCCEKPEEKESATVLRQSLRLRNKTEIKDNRNSEEDSVAGVSVTQTSSVNELKSSSDLIEECIPEKTESAHDFNSENTDVGSLLDETKTLKSKKAAPSRSSVHKNHSVVKSKSKESSVDNSTPSKRYSLRHSKSKRLKDDSANLGIDLNKLQLDTPSSRNTRSKEKSKFVKLLTSDPHSQNNDSSDLTTKRETRSSVAKSDKEAPENAPNYNLRNRKSIIAPAKLKI